MNNLVITGDGSHTIYVPEIGDSYHSVYGAIRESEHIFINSGFKYLRDDAVIFEAGFGTGLNALLTALKSLQEKRKVLYTSIEKYPLEDELVKNLNYPNFLGEMAGELFSGIHECRWNEDVQITPYFTLTKIRTDLITYDITGKFNLVYFDAFGPDKQPDMWSDEIFTRIASATMPGGILVTYSAKGQVRRRLQSAGFAVSLLPGPPGKRQIIRAVKK